MIKPHHRFLVTSRRAARRARRSASRNCRHRRHRPARSSGPGRPRDTDDAAAQAREHARMASCQNNLCHDRPFAGAVRSPRAQTPGRSRAGSDRPSRARASREPAANAAGNACSAQSARCQRCQDASSTATRRGAWRKAGSGLRLLERSQRHVGPVSGTDQLPRLHRRRALG